MRGDRALMGSVQAWIIFRHAQQATGAVLRLTIFMPHQAIDPLRLPGRFLAAFGPDSVDYPFMRLRTLLAASGLRREWVEAMVLKAGACQGASEKHGQQKTRTRRVS